MFLLGTNYKLYFQFILIVLLCPISKGIFYSYNKYDVFIVDVALGCFVGYIIYNMF